MTEWIVHLLQDFLFGFPLIPQTGTGTDSNAVESGRQRVPTFAPRVLF